MKNVSTTHFSFVFSKFFSLWREQFLCGVGDREPAQNRKSPWKKHQNGRERPHFSAFQPPKKFVESAPALRHGKSCRLFFPRDRQFGINNTSAEGGTECRSLRKHQGS